MVALAGEGDHGVVTRLLSYYDVDSHFAGASFADLAPDEWSEITATDLHATSLLSVEVGPQATRRLTSPGRDRDAVLRELRALPDVDFADAGTAYLLAMERFYRAVEASISSSTSKEPNPWVTASKLCARKRPALFPVRDRNVCQHLGILGLNDFRADWQVFRMLAQDEDVYAAVDALPGQVTAASSGRRIALDVSPLRLLDAAIWTHTIWGQ